MTDSETSLPTPTVPAADFHADIATRKIGLLQRLVAGLLHELNSPLAVLSTTSQLLEQVAERSTTFAGEDGDVVREVYKSQKQACDRIVETLTSLKTCVSLDEAEWKLVDVCRLLDSVIQLLRSTSGLQNDIVRDYDGSTFIEGSAHQLSQLFMNLLLNAMEAAGDSGSVTVSVREQSGDEVIVVFRDDGDGIHPDELPRVFDPGFTSGGTSAGLGLTICQYIVKEHRGRLSIESEPERGVQVLVHLPKKHVSS